jgi:ribosomal protein L29
MKTETQKKEKVAKKPAKVNVADLQKELGEKKISLRDIRFGAAHSKSKNVKEYSKIKKEIARIHTNLHNLKFKI